MASMYGGQSAASFGQGFSAGYSMVDSAKTNKQNRELKAQEASMRAKEFEQNNKFNSLKLNDMTTQSEMLNIMSEEVKRTNGELKKLRGNTTKTFANEFVATPSTNPGDQQRNLERWVANESPDTFKAMGIQNPATIGTVGEKDLPKLKAFMTSQYGADISNMSDDDWKTVLDSGLFTMADGAVKDMSQFVALSGSKKSMTTEQQEIFDSKQESVVSLFNKSQAQSELDAKLETKLEEKKLAAKLNEQLAQATGKSQLPKDRQTDTRSTLGKEFDDLAQRFPELSEDDIWAKLQEQRGSNSSTLPWDERLLKRKFEKLTRDGASPETMQKEMDKLSADIETKSTFGAAENREQEDEYVMQQAKGMGRAVLDSKSKDGTYAVGSLGLETQYKSTKEYKSKVSKRVDKFDDQTLAVKEAVSVRNELNKFITNGGDFGKLESVYKQISSVAPDELAGIVTLDSDELGKRFGITGGQSILVGQMVKAIYGGNASNIEGAPFRESFQITDWTNATAAKAKMDALIGITHRKTNTEGELLISKGLTSSVPTQLNELNKLVNTKSKPESTDTRKPLSASEKEAGWSYERQNGKTYLVNRKTGVANEVK